MNSIHGICMMMILCTVYIEFEVYSSSHATIGWTAMFYFANYSVLGNLRVCLFCFAVNSEGVKFAGTFWLKQSLSIIGLIVIHLL